MSWTSVYWPCIARLVRHWGNYISYRLKKSYKAAVAGYSSLQCTKTNACFEVSELALLAKRVSLPASSSFVARITKPLLGTPLLQAFTAFVTSNSTKPLGLWGKIVTVPCWGVASASVPSSVSHREDQGLPGRRIVLVVWDSTHGFLTRCTCRWRGIKGTLFIESKLGLWEYS